MTVACRGGVRLQALAFPGRYDFAEAAPLSRVETLTHYFVTRYTDFRDACEYYSHDTLTRDLTSWSR